MIRRKQLFAGTLAFLVTVSSLHAAFTVSADETVEVTEPVTEEALPEVLTEDAQDQNETGEHHSDEIMTDDANIIFAESPDEYFRLVSDLPDTERIIVDSEEGLEDIGASAGVYYDGTYILCFDSHDELSDTVSMLYDCGYEYALDGTLGICGIPDRGIMHSNINPDASVKVAVIDTGSDIANEKYSVIGDDLDDHNGHGTALSSIILEETSDAYIISIKAIGDDGQGYMSDVYAAVQMAEQMGADYILMAVSIRDCGKYDAFKSLIENTNATVVASAGNNGTDASYYIPACINGVITIGAVNGDGILNDCSNYGDPVDYYAEAGSTSEAAAKGLGMIISGRVSELITTPLEREPDNLFHLVFRAEDDDVCFTTDSSHAGENIYVYHKDDLINMYDMVASSGDWSRSFYYADDEPVGNKYQQSYYEKALFCIEDFKASPDNVDYQAYTYLDNIDSDSKKYKMIQAAGAFGPGGALYEYGLAWWKAHDPNDSVLLVKDARSMYIVTHYAMDWYYCDETTMWPGIPAFGDLLLDYMDYIYGVRTGSIKLPGLTLSGWWCEIYETTWNGSYQDMAHGDVTATPVQITVSKSSSNQAVNGNPCYSLAGTSYGLYRAGDNSLVHVFDIDESGNTTAYTLDPINDGTNLYIKEITAGRGYSLDATGHAINLNSAANNLVTVRVQDVPLVYSSAVTLVKHDENGWNLITERSLEDAVFRVEYFERTDINNLSDLGSLSGVTPKAAINLISKSSGGKDGSITIDINTLSAADKSGYFKALGGLPLGTYMVTEVTAPTGYSKAVKPLAFCITDDGGNAKCGYVLDNSIYKKITDTEIMMSEIPVTGLYSPLKSASGNESLIDGVHSLNGTRYGIYFKANDTLVCTVTFGADGTISNVEYNASVTPTDTWSSGKNTIELAEGDYYAKELSAGRWFYVDGSVYEFSIWPDRTSDMNFADQPIIPEISTSAKDSDTGTHQLSYKERVTIKDEVSFINLVPSEEYTLTGILYDAYTGEIYKDAEGNTYTKSVVFIPDDTNSVIADGTASGSTDIVFEDVLVSYSNTTLVVFEELYENQNDTLVAAHEDIDDEEQTVERYVPELKTTATDAQSGTHVLVYEEKVTINDLVTYTNLNPGEEYYLKGVLFDADTGELFRDAAGKTYTQIKGFTPSDADGEEILTFTDVEIPLTKTTIVVFEYLYEKTTDSLITSHADINDEDQTLQRPSCVTYATTLKGAKSFHNNAVVTLVDHVSYENLEAGHEYYAKASLYTTEGDQVVSGGLEVVSIRKFVPEEKDGTVEVAINFDPSTLSEGDRVVVFENIYEMNNDEGLSNGIQKEDILVLSHEDLNNREQSLDVTSAPPVPSLGDIPNNELILCLGVTFIVVGAVSLVIVTEVKRRKV